MKDKFLQEWLCRKFCRYYKPSKDESLACLGYMVVERLSEDGVEMLFQSAEGRPDASVEKLLVGSMCPHCPFYEDGCDFVQNVPDSSPCGGLILLGHMCERRAVSVGEIERIIERIK